MNAKLFPHFFPLNFIEIINEFIFLSYFIISILYLNIIFYSLKKLYNYIITNFQKPTSYAGYKIRDWIYKMSNKNCLMKSKMETKQQQKQIHIQAKTFSY